MSISPPTRQCNNCGNQLKDTERLCQQCGIPCPPERDSKGVFLGMDFKTVVIIVSIFCLIMVFWLPR